MNTKVQVARIEENPLTEANAIYAFRPLTVTLHRGTQFVTCSEVFFWDDEGAEYVFEEWMELAAAGEPEYTTHVAVDTMPCRLI